MLKIRGICVFPSQIEEILTSAQGVSPHYQIVVDREGVMDRLLVRVEISEDFRTDKLNELVALQRKLEDELKDTLSIKREYRVARAKDLAKE